MLKSKLLIKVIPLFVKKAVRERAIQLAMWTDNFLELDEIVTDDSIFKDVAKQKTLLEKKLKIWGQNDPTINGLMSGCKKPIGFQE